MKKNNQNHISTDNYNIGKQRIFQIKMMDE